MAGDFSVGARVWPGIAKLVEELGEAGQVCGKLIQTGGVVEHFDGSNLRLRLQEEIADVVAAIGFVVEANCLDDEAILKRADAKIELFRAWRAEAEKADLGEGGAS